jgi:4-hydroxy-tetrahydrodipicolinate reductase
LRPYKVVIVGSGKLAQSILDHLREFDPQGDIIERIEFFTPSIVLDGQTVLIHVGSGRQFNQTVQLAAKHRCYYIQGATEKDIPMDAPGDLRFVYVNAPNLSMDLIRFLYLMKLANPLFKNYKKRIIESHQSSKKSEAGTAKKICELLEIHGNEIISIRDARDQRTMGIENLDLHAYHQIIMGEGHSQIKFETKVEGHIPYVSGLLEIISVLDQLTAGYHDILDLVEQGIL